MLNRASGPLSGVAPNDLCKTGDGTFELSGTNIFGGGVIVAEGSLLTNNADGLGAADGPYVLLGARSDTASTVATRNCRCASSEAASM